MARITLVACVKQKEATATKAKDLYKSQLFKGCRTWAQNPQNSDSWFILSARHGLVRPDDVLHPYNVTLSNATLNMRKAWAEKTAEQLLPYLQPWDDVTFLAGIKYREPLLQMLQELLPQVRFIIPMEGKGIGRQLQWLRDQNRK